MTIVALVAHAGRAALPGLDVLRLPPPDRPRRPRAAQEPDRPARRQRHAPAPHGRRLTRGDAARRPATPARLAGRAELPRRVRPARRWRRRSRSSRRRRCSGRSSTTLFLAPPRPRRRRRRRSRCSPRSRSPAALLAWAFEAGGHLAASATARALRRRLVAPRARRSPRRSRRTASGEVATAAVRGIDALDPYFARYLPQLVLGAVVPVVILAARRDAGRHSRRSSWPLTLPLIPIFGVLVGRATAGSCPRALCRARAALDATSSTSCAASRRCGRSTAAALQAEKLAESGERYRRETMGTLRIAFLSALVLELAATLGTAVVAVEIGIRLDRRRHRPRAGAHDPRPRARALRAAAQRRRAVPRERRRRRRRRRTSSTRSSTRPRARRRARSRRSIRATCRCGSSTCRSPTPAATVACSTTSRWRSRRASASRSSARAAPARARSRACSCASTTRRRAAARQAAPTFADADPDAWRRHIAWVPQRPHLPAGTIGDAIRLGAPGAHDRRRRGRGPARRRRGLHRGPRRRLLDARRRRRRGPLGRPDPPHRARARIAAGRLAAAPRRADHEPRRGERRGRRLTRSSALPRTASMLLITHDEALAQRICRSHRAHRRRPDRDGSEAPA